MKKIINLLFLTAVIVLSGCSKDDDINTKQRQFGIFKVLSDDTTIEMNGEIGDETLINFNKLLVNFPEVSTINIKEVPGSGNDQINLQVSKKVNEKGINTHILDNGLIASGGVDFFLAGAKRTKGTNTQIGVHSWGGEDDNGNTVTATDFPVGHEYHLEYIAYYIAIGFTQQDAEAFYYFTINAASANDIHWMTEAEVEEYKILTP